MARRRRHAKPNERTATAVAIVSQLSRWTQCSLPLQHACCTWLFFIRIYWLAFSSRAIACNRVQRARLENAGKARNCKRQCRMHVSVRHDGKFSRKATSVARAHAALGFTAICESAVRSASS